MHAILWEWKNRVYLFEKRYASNEKVMKKERDDACSVLFDCRQFPKFIHNGTKHWRTLTKISMHMDYVNHDD